MADKTEADQLWAIAQDQEAAGGMLVRENERLQAQVIAATESGEHWYRLWTERSAEVERLNGFVAEMQPELGKLKTEVERLKKMLKEHGIEDM